MEVRRPGWKPYVSGRGREIIRYFELDRMGRVCSLTRGMEGSPRQKRAAIMRAAGLGPGEACRVAGYESSRGVIFSKGAQVRNVELAQERLCRYLDDNGVGLGDIAKNIASGVRAKKLTREGPQDDHQAQIRYNDMALKVHGAYAPTKSVQDVRKVSLNTTQITVLQALEQQGELETQEFPLLPGGTDD